MDTPRIAELLRPFFASGGRGEPPSVSQTQLQYISMYIDILLRWNSRINLTAIRGPDEIVSRHFGESLFAGKALFPDANSRGRLIDVGSGAGFPGLPIKILRPDVQVTLIESNQKKAAFLREVIRSLGLTGIDVFQGRAEDHPEGAGEVVTLRAVERFECMLPVAAKLLSPAGLLGLLIGGAQVPVAHKILSQLDWEPEALVPMSSSRVLLVGKAGNTQA